MCRSLLQTPAALTLTRTCVPDGCGVGSSTSVSGALKSVTLKLFIVSLPKISYLLAGHCHDLPSSVETSRSASGLLGQADLREDGVGMLAQSRRPRSGRHLRSRHPERQIEHLERAAGVLDLGQRTAMGKLRISERLGHGAIRRARHAGLVQ